MRSVSPEVFPRSCNALGCYYFRRAFLHPIVAPCNSSEPTSVETDERQKQYDNDCSIARDGKMLFHGYIISLENELLLGFLLRPSTDGVIKLFALYINRTRPTTLCSA